MASPIYKIIDASKLLLKLSGREEKCSDHLKGDYCAWCELREAFKVHDGNE